MSGVKCFTDLGFWQRARKLSKTIFCLTRHDPFRGDRRLVIQINDSSESVMANIAEGIGRGTQGEFVAFLGYAIGSLNETQSHLCTAYDREYISKEDFATLFQAHCNANEESSRDRSMPVPRVIQRLPFSAWALHGG